MIKTDLKQFITLITNDIKKLFEEIEKKEKKIKDLIDRKTNYFDDIYIEKGIFRNLFNKYIFNQEYSGVLNHNNQEFRTRYELFNKIFLAEFKDKRVFELFNYAFDYFIILFKEPELFYYLCYDIFRKKILYDSKIEEIIEQNLKIWEILFKKHELPVKISLALPKLNIYDDIQLSSGLKITTKQNLKLIREGEQTEFELNNLIEYKTSINVNKDSQNQQFEERDRIEAKFTELILSLYLYEFDFKQTNFIITGPWLVEPYSSDDISKLGAWVGFLKPDISIKQTIELYHKIIKTQIVYNDKWDIIISRYCEFHNRKNIFEKILDASIILEIIFTKGERSELSYRFANNAAFFLSENEKKFDNNYLFFKKLYKIRSSIVHGGDWKSVLEKCIKDLKIQNENGFIELIKNKLRVIIIKLIDLELSENGILKKLEGHYFLNCYLKQIKTQLKRENLNYKL